MESLYVYLTNEMHPIVVEKISVIHSPQGAKDQAASVCAVQPWK